MNDNATTYTSSTVETKPRRDQSSGQEELMRRTNKVPMIEEKVVGRIEVYKGPETHDA